MGGVGAGAGAAVRAELGAALRWARSLCRTLRMRRDAKEARALLLACKDWPECARRLLTLLNLHQRTPRLPHAALGNRTRSYLYETSHFNVYSIKMTPYT